MLIIRAFLLWTLISVHIVGAAFLFRRLFPRESIWLGFVIPEIIIVLACNFVEHLVALPTLRFLLPLTTMAAMALIVSSKSPWRVMRLPSVIFLGAFAFTLSLRILNPSILNVRDGISDLGVISNFMFGQTLPVESTWIPPIKMLHYYCLEHYGASVLIRLLGVDIGTGFNLCAALVGAYIYFLVGATAWLLTRGKLWIVLLMLFLTACAATGDAGYLWLTVKDLEPENIINPYSLFDHDDLAGHGLLRLLTPIYMYDRHQLTPPAYWSWMGCFHSSEVGQFVVCFFILALIELVRFRKSNWPWIGVALVPFLMLITCTWGVPLIGLMTVTTMIVCLKMKLRPKNWGFVLVIFVGIMALLEPMLSYFLIWHFQPLKLATGLHTQVMEFLVLWWPVYLPWITLICIWKHLHPVTRIVVITTPLAFAGIETWNLGPRYDMTAKLWGMTYAAAWITFLPVVAMQRTWPFRLILGLIVLNSVFSLSFWTTYYWQLVDREDIGHLEGQGSLRIDRRKARILEVLSRLDNQIIIPGNPGHADIENALLTELSHNRGYVVMSRVTDDAFYSNGIMEGYRRETPVNMLYEGKIDNPLFFLRQRDVAALVIYPDDDIDSSVVDKLRQSLAPYYTYEDGNRRMLDQIREGTSPLRPCAGVFIYHPEITTLLGSPKDNGTK